MPSCTMFSGRVAIESEKKEPRCHERWGDWDSWARFLGEPASAEEAIRMLSYVIQECLANVETAVDETPRSDRKPALSGQPPPEPSHSGERALRCWVV